MKISWRNEIRLIALKNNHPEILTPRFFEAVRETIERRLKVAKGKCLMTVRVVASYALKEIGVNKKKDECWIRELGHLEVTKIMEEYGGRFYMNTARRGKRTGPAGAVYKFE